VGAGTHGRDIAQAHAKIPGWAARVLSHRFGSDSADVVSNNARRTVVAAVSVERIAHSDQWQREHVSKPKFTLAERQVY
jgi:hypothetical protein